MHDTPPLSSDYQEIFDKSPFPCALLSSGLIILACNEAYENSVNRPRREMLSRYLFDVFPGQGSSREALEQSFAFVREHRQAQQIPLLHYPILAKNAAEDQYMDRYWTVSNVPVVDENGELRLILHHPTDITELTRLRQTNKENLPAAVPASELDGTAFTNGWGRDVREILNIERERLRQLFQQAPGFICVLRGPKHIFEQANDAYYQLIGHRPILGCVLADVLPEVIEQGYLDKLDRVFATGKPFIGRALPIQLQRVAGGPLGQCYIDLVYQPIRDPGGQVSGIFVQGHDVTEAHKLAREIAYQAAHDSLTGLYNRQEFAKKSRALDELVGPHALLYMDLDHFKIINDRSGHAAGDALLQHVAAVLQQQVTKLDVLARLGGDEFALILPGRSEEDALELAHALRRKVRDIPFVWDGRRYSVTLSIGLVRFDALQSLSFAEALSLADVACLLAKEKGRNRVQVNRTSDLEITQRQLDMDWTGRIKDCIRQDRVVLYSQRFTAMQPQQHEAVECREVLARLLDSEGNLVFPGAFIPAAERFGLIGELDQHIIRKAFAKLHSLSATQRANIRFFINVSGITIGEADFSAYIARMLVDYVNVRPRHVCFEVTETAAISNLAHTADTIRQLAEQGFSFALDDFGSGMSSFSYLQQLPVQYLKIDGEFIKGMLTQPAGISIVEAVVKVARAMNILTVAESVEFPELLPHLREIGIDYGQGFALHRPEPL